MNKTDFIKLHEVEGKGTININVYKIVAIIDLRTDHCVKGKDSWQWTSIKCEDGRTYDVRETEEEIFELMKQNQ